MTKIIIKDNKVIFDGHANNKADCGTITNIVNTLAKSNNFKEISNENGYAEFESLTNDELKFAPDFKVTMNVTINFDSNILSVCDYNGISPGDYSWTTSGQTLSISHENGDALVLGINYVNANYELNTVTGSDAIYNINQFIQFTGDGFYLEWSSAYESYEITITSKPKLITHDVTINANGGTGTSTLTDKTEVTTSDLVTIKSQITRTGYLLTGLSLTAGGTAVTLPYSLTANTTMYCVWVEKDNLQSKVTKLITYGKSQLSSKGVTSTATTLLGVLNDIANIEDGMPIDAVTMPTPSADNLGKIYKYTGTTDSNYTNGELYIVQEVS